MKITVLVEGRTEQAFKPHLVEFLRGRLAGRMPVIDFFPCNGRVYKEDKLRRTVEILLANRNRPSDAVIALTDVYTGNGDFADAADAKAKMRGWVGSNPKFYPHAAQYDFEAWLLPYWADIIALAGHNKQAPSAHPETVNHNKPPSRHIGEVFRTGSKGRTYSKARDANRILTGNDLAVSAGKCSELKAFLNTILSLSGGQEL